MPELDFAGAIAEDESLFVDIPLGRLGAVQVEIGYVLALFDGGLPASRFEALHLFSNALECEGGGAGLGPEHVAVDVVAVVVGVENVADGLGGDAFHIGHGGAGAAGIIGVDDDDVIFHLDNDVVGVALIEIAFAEPDSRRHDAHGLGIGLGARCQKSQAGKDGKSGQQQTPEPPKAGQQTSPPESSHCNAIALWQGTGEGTASGAMLSNTEWRPGAKPARSRRSTCYGARAGRRRAGWRFPRNSRCIWVWIREA